MFSCNAAFTGDERSQKETALALRPATAAVADQVSTGRDSQMNRVVPTPGENSAKGVNGLSGCHSKGGEVEPMHSSGEDPEAEEDEEDSLRRRKRARVNGEGDARPTEVDPPVKRVTLPRDSDGFIPGSIVRVQMRNFMSHEWAEFCTGPYLNMIIGPNAAGKSSICCAICIGLNFHVNLLNRADDLMCFVTKERSHGHVEIELKGPRGHPNLIIRRNFKSEANTTSFRINGSPATGREVSARVTSLNVQINNLCCFLPQERVSEFAMMSPQQLLKETQRATGDARLLQWHEMLVDLDKRLQDLRKTLKTTSDDLKVSRERNEDLERQVAQFRARRVLEDEIKLLQLRIPAQQFREAHFERQRLKVARRELRDYARKLRDRNKAVHDFKETLQRRYVELVKVRDDQRRSAKQGSKQMEQTWKTSERMDDQATSFWTQLDDIKKTEKARLKRIQDLKAKIQNLESDLASPPQMEDSERLVQEFKAARAADGEVKRRLEELQERQRRNVGKSTREQRIMQQAEQELKKLDDVNEQKLVKLAKWNRDAADAARWLRANRHRFKMDVFEPPILSVTVIDRRHVDAVEACFGSQQLCTFVAQCDEDLRTFNYLLVDNASPDGLGRQVRVDTWYRPQDPALVLPTPMPREEMAALGFDGYALDFVDCPFGMKWFLRASVNLHRKAIGNYRIDVNAAMKAVTKDVRGGGATFFTGNTMNTVTRSPYGRKAVSNSTRNVKRARNFTNSNADPSLRVSHESNVANARQQLNAIEEDARQLTEEEQAIRAEHAQVTSSLKSLDKRRNALKQQMKDMEQKRTNLITIQQQLQNDLQAPPVDVLNSRVRCQLAELTQKRVQIAGQYQALMRVSIDHQVQATRTLLELMQVSANKAELERLCKVKEGRWDRTIADLEKVEADYEHAKAQSEEYFARSQRMMEDAEPEIRQKFREMEAPFTQPTHEAETQDTRPNIDMPDSEQLRVDLGSLQEQLDNSRAPNPGVVKQYERRKDEIAELERIIRSSEQASAKVERDMKATHNNWTTALRKLVNSINAKFSASFERIRRAGEIRIREHEEYDKWAIDILVKFRESEKLQLLTGQRQSGGERSLTTIMYLLSLTEQARFPFSLVDEINQGFDPEAERDVHQNIVEVTCQPDSAQYFLITPKLLSDLDYHPRMKILCLTHAKTKDKQVRGSMIDMIDASIRRGSTSTATSV